MRIVISVLLLFLTACEPAFDQRAPFVPGASDFRLFSSRSRLPVSVPCEDLGDPAWLCVPNAGTQLLYGADTLFGIITRDTRPVRADANMWSAWNDLYPRLTATLGEPDSVRQDKDPNRISAHWHGGTEPHEWRLMFLTTDSAGVVMHAGLLFACKRDKDSVCYAR